MIEKIDHIGIVVASLDEAVPHYRDTLGLDYQGTEVVPDGTVRVAFFRTGESSIELIEPIDNPGVQRFLEKRGGGIHHICLRTDDLKAELARMAAAGAELIDQEPRPGAHGTQVAFIHPRTMGGVLVELSEAGEDTHHE